MFVVKDGWCSNSIVMLNIMGFLAVFCDYMAFKGCNSDVLNHMMLLLDRGAGINMSKKWHRALNKVNIGIVMQSAGDAVFMWRGGAMWLCGYSSTRTGGGERLRGRRRGGATWWSKGGILKLMLSCCTALYYGALSDIVCGLKCCQNTLIPCHQSCLLGA